MISSSSVFLGGAAAVWLVSDAAGAAASAKAWMFWAAAGCAWAVRSVSTIARVFAAAGCTAAARSESFGDGNTAGRRFSVIGGSGGKAGGMREAAATSGFVSFGDSAALTTAFVSEDCGGR